MNLYSKMYISYIPHRDIPYLYLEENLLIPKIGLENVIIYRLYKSTSHAHYTRRIVLCT
jgi:hypothetical protein